MLFNLNEFLISISYALDFIELDLFGLATNHSKRVAYISMKMSEILGFSKEEIYDIVAFAILHDNGASEKILKSKIEDNAGKSKRTILESAKEHCIIGEKNIKDYPFLTDNKEIIKYHHEYYDGSGFFGLKAGEIPLMSQIIRFADDIDINFDIKSTHFNDKEKICKYIHDQKNKKFSPQLVEAFSKICSNISFWIDIKDDFVNYALNKNFPDFTIEFNLSKIHEITNVFSKIIDSKSTFTQLHSRGLSQKIAVLGEYYNKPKKEILSLQIAADLHDIGKLIISNSILDKPGKLDDTEFYNVKLHPYYTRVALHEIHGFEDITEWASNHHERLDGSGYPFGKKENDLDFNSRLMACLDVYQALKEERPYRGPMNHEEAISILKISAQKGELDSSIVEDIQKVFKK